MAIQELDDPDRVRTVALVGPSRSGKSTLLEALAGAHQPPVGGLTRATLVHRGIKVNLLDGDPRLGLRAADAALFVSSAAADGSADASAQLWEECAGVGMPRAVAITRLDHERADFDAALAHSQEAFGGDEVLALYLPMLGDDAVSVAGLIDLITTQVHDYSAGHIPTVRDPDREHLTAIAAARDDLLSAIVAQSEDDTLLERYLQGEPIPAADLARDLHNAVAHGLLSPAVPVCAATGVGLDRLLDLVTQAFPPPRERPLPAVTGVDGSPRPPLTADPAGPLVAQVIATDPTASLVRVFSGTLRTGTTVHLAGHGADRLVVRLLSPTSTSIVAGDIGALATSAVAHPGDTLSATEDPLLLRP